MAAGLALHLVHVRRYELQVRHAPLAALGASKAFCHQVALGRLMEALPVALQGILGPELLVTRWAFHGVFTSVSYPIPYITLNPRNIKLFL
jgi:hypothetical protein